MLFCEFVVFNPGTACVHMSFDTEPGPVIQFLAYYFADCLWLKTQRIAGQVYGRFSIYCWQMEFVPEPAQWVGSVQFTRESQSFFIDHVLLKKQIVNGFKEYAAR